MVFSWLGTYFGGRGSNWGSTLSSWWPWRKMSPTITPGVTTILVGWRVGCTFTGFLRDDLGGGGGASEWYSLARIRLCIGTASKFSFYFLGCSYSFHVDTNFVVAFIFKNLDRDYVFQNDSILLKLREGIFCSSSSSSAPCCIRNVCEPERSVPEILLTFYLFSFIAAFFSRLLRTESYEIEVM